LLERWLADSVTLTVRASSLASYRQIARIHITPKIGAVKLAKLGTAHIQNLIAEMTRANKSPRLVQMAYAVLHRALFVAVRWGLVIRNVAEAVDRPTVPKHEITPLNAEQAKSFLEAAEADRLYALYVLALMTGCRQGELFGLEWADIDLKAGTLMVRRTLVELGGKITTNEPKTAKGRRLIELPQMAVEALWQHKTLLLTEGLASCPLVFCDSVGSHLRRQNVLRRSFQPILKRAGLKDVRFHDLRHSSATLLLSAGVHPKIVQERLGHSQIGITMDIYSHVLPSMQREASGKLDGLLRKAIG
jgi:integrase